MDSLNWLKEKKKATINPINKKDKKCFQYALEVALNDKQIKKDSQRITKIKTFISNYDREGKIFYQKKMIGKGLRKIK